MKFQILILYVMIACNLFAGTGKKDNPVLASIGSHQITLSEFSDRYTDYLISAGVQDKYYIREAILNNMTNEVILYYYDDNKSIFNDVEYNNEMEWVRKQAILAFLKDQEVFAKITVTEAELRDAFVKVNENISARHLFAATEDEANNLYNLLQMGFDFNTLAKQVFTDSVLQNNGGYLGYFTWGDMDPEFEDAAFKLKIGEISKPVKTARGYSIIKLEDRQPHPLLTEYEFQTKKNKLEQTLRLRKRNPFERSYLNQIYDKSKVIFNEQALEELWKNLSAISTVESINKNNNDKNCVEYDGKKYLSSLIEQKISEIPSYHRIKITSRESLKAVIEGLIIQERLYDEALKKGYDTVSVVKKTIKKLQDNTFLKFKLSNILDAAIVSDSELIDYYKNNIHYFTLPEEINLQEIIVDRKDLSDSLLVLIKSGKDFGELAREFSLRDWSAKHNGEIGFSPIDKFGNLKETFTNSNVGELIGPVRIENYYGLFKILGKKDPKPIEFSIIKKSVRDAFIFEQRTKLRDEYINKIRNGLEIKIDYKLLASFNILG